MEKLVRFRDYQEEQAEDHNDLQAYARQSIDHLVNDAVTATRLFSGFNVSKTGQTEITIAPGRFYDVQGAVYSRANALVQSMIAHLAASSKIYVTVAAYGVETDADVAERDFLTNVETGATEPKSVAMTSSRDAVLVFVRGTEGVDPRPPTLSVGQVAIANILLDATQVVSVSMIDENKVASTSELDQRTDVLEDFKDQIGPRVASLASDLADLANRLRSSGTQNAVIQLMFDMARVKEGLRYPSNAAGYGADFFLLPKQSDDTNSAGLGYDAKVEEGIRFADANADEFEISLFSANDPNASLNDGLLLPKFTDEKRISTGAFHSDLGIAQYGFQTHEMKVGYLSRSRLRYGGGYTVCSNGVYWDVTPGYPAAQNLYDFETTDITTNETIYTDPTLMNGRYVWQRKETYWFDTWKEPYMYAQVTDHTIQGALVAQTFLNTNDMWATKLGIYISAKGANENIYLTLCEVTNGVPDKSKAILHTVIPHASIVLGMNLVAIKPTFLTKGKLYALIAVSNANHKVGMAEGQSYLQGTFFYSTDGQYFLGDLTKDMMVEVWGAKFNAAQVTIEFAPANLDGGFRMIDILSEMYVPYSTTLLFELRPNGTGEWLPLTSDLATVLSSAPPLAHFRARFIGTTDMQAAIKLTGSRVRLKRPKTAFRHVSSLIAVPSTSTVVVKTLLERFNDTPHDIACKLRVGAGYELPDTTVTKLLSAQEERYEVTYTFNLAAPTTTFRIQYDGTTTSPANIFHVAERTYYVT